METIFREAMNRIHAKEELKRKTEDSLIAYLNASPAVSPRAAKYTVRQKAVAAACALVFVCAMSVAGATYYKTPASYLSLDINPSIELGINTFGRIVSATAYNSEGSTILNGQDIMDSDVKSAVHKLVKSAAQKGYVAKDGSTVISVTSETDNTATAAALEDAAAQGADSAVKAEGKTATINKDNIPLEKRSEAQKLAITPGKLSLIRKLQALDPSITVNEYKDCKVTDIIKKIDELNTEKPTNDGKKDDPDPENQEETPGKTVDSAEENSSGSTVDENSKDPADETVSEEPPDSSGSEDSGKPSDSSDNGETEESHAASSNTGSKGKPSSLAQSHSNNSKGTKSSSHISSSLSSQPSSNPEKTN